MPRKTAAHGSGSPGAVSAVYGQQQMARYHQPAEIGKGIGQMRGGQSITRSGRLQQPTANTLSELRPRSRSLEHLECPSCNISRLQTHAKNGARISRQALGRAPGTSQQPDTRKRSQQCHKSRLTGDQRDSSSRSWQGANGSSPAPRSHSLRTPASLIKTPGGRARRWRGARRRRPARRPEAAWRRQTPRAR